MYKNILQRIELCAFINILKIERELKMKIKESFNIILQYSTSFITMLIILLTIFIFIISDIRSIMMTFEMLWFSLFVIILMALFVIISNQIYIQEEVRKLKMNQE